MTKSFANQIDAAVLFRVGTGDSTAFKLLVTRHHRSFMAMAIANSLSYADSEEAVGDAFLKIWVSASKYEDLGIDPKYWLRTLMRHALLDKLRTLKRFTFEQSASKTDEDGNFITDDYGDSESIDASNLATPIGALETKQASHCFEVCLQTLSEAHRNALQRTLLAGQTEYFNCN